MGFYFIIACYLISIANAQMLNLPQNSFGSTGDGGAGGRPAMPGKGRDRDSKCGWSIEYFEWESAHCSRMKYYYERDRIQSIVNEYHDDLEDYEKTSKVLNPGFEITYPNTNFPFFNGYMFTISGAQRAQSRHLRKSCNGVKFETSLGGKDIILAEKEIWFDVYQRQGVLGADRSGNRSRFDGGTHTNQYVGHILSVNGVAQHYEHNSISGGNIQNTKHQFSDSRSSQTVSVYYFQFANFPSSNMEPLFFAVVPYFLNVVVGESDFPIAWAPMELVSDRDASSLSQTDLDLSELDSYVEKVRLARGDIFGKTQNEVWFDNMQILAGKDIFGTFESRTHFLDWSLLNAGAPNSDWCDKEDVKQGFFNFNNAEREWLNVDSTPRSGDAVSVYSGSIKISVGLLGGEFDSAMLTVSGKCRTSKAVRKTESMWYHGSSYMAVDPCGTVDIMGRFIPRKSKRLATVRCVIREKVEGQRGKVSRCFAPTNSDRLDKYCYSTVTFGAANRICGKRGSRLPSLHQSSLCCVPNNCCHGLQSSVLIWTRKRLVGKVKKESLILPDYNEAYTPESSGQTFFSVQFYTETGKKLVEKDGGYTMYMPNADESAQIEALYGVGSNCNSLEITVLAKGSVINSQTGYSIKTIREWRVRQHMGVHTTLFDFNDGNSGAFSSIWDYDIRAVDSGFADYSSINFFADQKYPSPRFNVKREDFAVVAGSYGVVWNGYLSSASDGCVVLRLECLQSRSFCALFIANYRGGYDLIYSSLVSKTSHNDHFQLCFDDSQRYVGFEVHYVRFTNEHTSIRLYWAHSLAVPGEDPEALVKSSDFQTKPLNDENAWDTRTIYHEDLPFRIIPPNGFFGSLPGDDVKWSVTCSDFHSTESGNADKPVCVIRLNRKPTHEVNFHLTGTVAFGGCVHKLWPNSFKRGYMFRYTVTETTTVGSNEICVTTQSEDNEFNNLVICNNVIFPELSTKICTVAVNGDLESELISPRIRLNDEYPLNSVWLLHPGKEFRLGPYVSAYFQKCGSGSGTCVTGAMVYYGGDMVRMYKHRGTDRKTEIRMLARDRKNVFFKVDEQWGCYVVRVNGNSVWICPVGEEYLSITIEMSYLWSEEKHWTGSGRGGLCLTNHRPSKGNLRDLRYPVQRSVTRRDIRWCFRYCEGSPRWNSDNYANISIPVMTNGRMTITPTVEIKPEFLTRKPCTDTLVWGGGLVNAVLGMNPTTREICSRLYNSVRPHHAKIAFSQFQYWHSVSFFPTISQDAFLESNPLLCPNGSPSMNGGCSPGSFVILSPERTIKPCNNDISVLVDKVTGEVYKCYLGNCMYSQNGFEWRGLLDSTVHCVSALSKDPSTGTTTLWGFTENGVEVRSLDKGNTFQPAPYILGPKDKLQKSITEDTHFVYPSPGKKGNSHSVPSDTFGGRGTDLWWLTAEELCVSSSRLTGKSMIYCSVWWCECLDRDAWKRVFGVQVE